jgi:hypothetical protein
MSFDTRVGELVSRWLDAPAGAKPTPEALCAACPELLDEVRRQVFANTGAPVPPSEVGATLPPPMHHDQYPARADIQGRADETIAPRSDASSWFQPRPPLTDDDADRHAHANTIKGYVKQSIVGEGGMGVVWRAEQVGTRRVVALKTIAGSFAGSTRVQLRFAREIELAASLEHPYIARVYDGGISQGTYYCAMELVDGLPVTRYAAEHDLPRRQRVELMLHVCDGVRFAHENGVIHRDLKPSNVLVRSGDGTPKILDFGLAKLVRDGASEGGLTLSGDVIGTPAYMAPEQARGDSARTDTRGDVWSLGAILFELLIGSPPFDVKGSYVDIVRRVAEEEPRRPRALCPDLDRELEAVLLKCLSRDPAVRYATAGGLAEDIQRYLDGEPVAARPATALYFLRKRVARYRGRFALAAAIVLAAAVGAAAYVISIERERARTWQAKLESDRNAQQSVQRAQQAILQRAEALKTIRAFTVTAHVASGATPQTPSSAIRCCRSPAMAWSRSARCRARPAAARATATPRPPPWSWRRSRERPATSNAPQRSTAKPSRNTRRPRHGRATATSRHWRRTARSWPGSASRELYWSSEIARRRGARSRKPPPASTCCSASSPPIRFYFDTSGPS